MNRKHCNFCFHFKRSWNVKKKEKDKFPDESIGLELKFVPKPGKKGCLFKFQGDSYAPATFKYK